MSQTGNKKSLALFAILVAFWQGVLPALGNSHPFPATLQRHNASGFAALSSQTKTPLALNPASHKATIHLVSTGTDTTLPTLQITTPRPAPAVPYLDTISGTAADEADGSGLGKVEVYLRRLSDGVYWGGSSWGDTSPTPLPTTLNKGAWTTMGSMPEPKRFGGDTYNLLSDGDYSIVAYAYDNSGNQGSASSNFTADTTAPNIAITSPATVPNDVPNVKSLVLAGNASDEHSLDRVTFTLQRDSDDFYWTGSQWSKTATPLSTTLKNGLWQPNVALPLPSATDATRLQDGSYWVEATAYDSAGNNGSDYSYFYIDATPPSAVINNPLPSSTVTSLPVLSGEAKDNMSLKTVQVSLKRNADGLYWTGTAWGTKDVFWLPIAKQDKSAPNRTNNWIVSSALPTPSATDSAKRLDAGSYTAQLNVSDVAGNSQSATSVFTVSSQLRAATTLTVTMLADDGTPGTLRSQIAAAVPGDTIVFQSGLTGTIKLNGTELVINSDLTIQGPGATRIKISGQQASRVFNVKGNKVVLSGLTVMQGNCVGEEGGGGIHHSALSSLTLNDCILTNNSAPAWRDGESDGGGRGAGIYSDGQLSVHNCNVSNNDGDGIYGFGTALIVDNSTISNNKGTGLDGGTLTLTRCVISGNAGGLSIGDHSTVNNSLIYNNKNTGIYFGAGGIVTSGTVTINNCTITENSGGLGSGIMNFGGALFVNNCTITGNYSSSVGGGIFNEDFFFPNNNPWSCQVNNSIVANNTAKQGFADIYSYHDPDSSSPPTAVTGDYNLVQNVTGTTLSGTHNIKGRDPKLGKLASNGGPTQTLAPLAGSPIINAGDPAFTSTGTDQRDVGFPRVLNGRVDIGAFETYIDSQVPLIAISAPANGSTVASLASINGSASDDVAVTKVEVSLKRKVDGKLWTGTMWASTATPLSTRLSSGLWKTTSRLPSSDLTDGIYIVTATAYDNVGKKRAVTSTFSVDKTPPTAVIIKTPPAAAIIANLPNISGTATDKGGLLRVDLYLQRKIDGLYWGGTAWARSMTPLVTDLKSNAWSRTGGLPSLSSGLKDGFYNVIAIAIDKAGNKSLKAASSFAVDATPPTPTINSPANTSILKSLSTMSGTARDNAGGSGLGKLQITLRRGADSLYWTGRMWGAKTDLLLTWQGDTWTVSSPLPSPVSGTLNDGNYLIAATATDKVGNAQTLISTFTVDNTRPSVADVVTPSSNATVTSLPVISVKATDNGTGSIAKVSVYLLRSDGVFWNGTSWGDTKDAALPTALKDGLWSTTGALPIPNTSNPKIKLTPGDYTIFAYAYDQAGNATDDKSAFHVPASAQAAAQVSTPATASPTVTPPPSAPSPSAPGS